MPSTQKEIFYTTKKNYSTLNTLTKKTKYVWFVCHGMGYLSRYFIRYFKDLDTQEHYIIAPQAPSLYYQEKDFKHVGASWLTKENTLLETQNIFNYFDAIFEAENISKNTSLIILGYSQGVSVALRYLAKRHIQITHLVIHSGSIPKELTVEDFKFLKAKVTLIYGTEDEYLNIERIAYETNRAKELFGSMLEIIPFKGKHTVNVEILSTLF